MSKKKSQETIQEEQQKIEVAVQQDTQKTLYQELLQFSKDIKSSLTKRMDNDSLLKKVDAMCLDKFNVEVNTGLDRVVFEAVTQKQADCLSTLFEAYKKQIESEQEKKNNGFQAVHVKWPEENVPAQEDNSSKKLPLILGAAPSETTTAVTMPPEEDCGCGSGGVASNSAQSTVVEKPKKTTKKTKK